MRITRRTLIQSTAVFSVLPLSACGGASEASDGGTQLPNNTSSFTLPDEGALHSATWMAYGATAEAWGTTGVYGASRAIARKDLVRIAANLSRFEPVKMLVSNQADKTAAMGFLAQIKGEKISTLASRYEPGTVFTGGHSLPAIEAGGKIEWVFQAVNDLWMRDTGPVFVWGADRTLHGVNLNFNGWGQESTGAPGWQKDIAKAANGVQDQRIAEDKLLANFVLSQANAANVASWLVMEGGGIEVNGKGTAICTESCILNINRNPGKSKAQIEAELARLFGIKKIIWLPGIKAKEITDGHIDFYARFVGDSTVVYALDTDPQSPDYAVTQTNQKILQGATDALGNKLKLIALNAPDFNQLQPVVESRNQWDTGRSHFNSAGFAAGYVGFYVANGCVLLPQFGDAKADIAAFQALSAAYPERRIVQITTDGIANGGGTIHCATQQQIAI